VVTQIFTSWNQLDGWLRLVEAFGGRRESGYATGQVRE
jgi:hypothetical protein